MKVLAFRSDSEIKAESISFILLTSVICLTVVLIVVSVVSVTRGAAVVPPTPILLQSLQIFIPRGVITTSSALSITLPQFSHEIFIAVVIAGALVGSAAGLYHVSDGKIFGGTRVGTMLERIGADYSVEQLESLEERSTEWYKVRDAIKQPYTARIAVHEGGIIGKGSGNSTQKYVVTHIYSDYMFSFIVEEYGLLGGIFIIILFVSLLARGSTIARFCNEEYAQILVGGLSLMITCQAFMHISVNVGIGPMTGQTLPLISDGSFAYLMFCFAFGVILSISRLAKKQIQEEEEAFAKQYGNKDDIQVAMDVLDEINSDNNDI
jgi:cell division protein FtsW